MMHLAACSRRIVAWPICAGATVPAVTCSLPVLQALSSGRCSSNLLSTASINISTAAVTRRDWVRLSLPQPLRAAVPVPSPAFFSSNSNNSGGGNAGRSRRRSHWKSSFSAYAAAAAAIAVAGGGALLLQSRRDSVAVNQQRENAELQRCFEQLRALRQQGSPLAAYSIDSSLGAANLPLLYAVACAAAFLVLKSGIAADLFERHMCTSIDHLRHRHVHTLLTHALNAGGDILTVAISAWTVYSLGTMVSQIGGPSSFLGLVAGSAVFSGLTQSAALAGQGLRGVPHYGVAGVLMGMLGYLYVNAPHHSIQIFPIPVPISMEMLAASLGLFSAVSLVLVRLRVPLPYQLAHAAHLTGLLFGLAYAYVEQQRRPKRIF